MFCSIGSYNACLIADFQQLHRLTNSQLFCHLFLALLMIRYSKSVHKSAVQVSQVTTVVMETTQLVLSQFKSF